MVLAIVFKTADWSSESSRARQAFDRSEMYCANDWAGERLLASVDPDRWREVGIGARIVEGNQPVIAECAKAAQEARKVIRCSMDVGA
jgi:hypothetical protein